MDVTKYNNEFDTGKKTQIVPEYVVYYVGHTQQNVPEINDWFSLSQHQENEKGGTPNNRAQQQKTENILCEA